MLFGESCNNSNEEVEKSRKINKKKRSMKKEALVEPIVQEDNKSKGISCNDLLLSYIFDRSGDNSSNMVSEENDYHS